MYVGRVLALILILLPTNAHAYIDPGTGSIVLQFVIAGLVSGLYVIKKFWSNIKSFFQRNTDTNPK